jgi:hypothetical protein
VEVVIGRLVTDERFRQAYRADPRAALDALAAEGLPLTPIEREALVLTPPGAWDAVACALDPRIRKVALPQDAPVS